MIRTVLILMMVFTIGCARSTSDAPRKAGRQADSVFVSANGVKFHREKCKYVLKSNMKFPRKEAVEFMYDPCELCKP